MPLIKSGSREAISSNISEMVKAGHPRNQAIAAALSTARKYGKATGGGADTSFVRRASSIKLGHEGMINSSIPGRTDKIPLKVRTGSYVVPSDVISGMGEGNTAAGGEIFKNMFSRGPYGMPLSKGGGRGGNSGRMKKMFAKGGETEGEEDYVPIIAAGGEGIIHPDVVQHIGNGNMTHGHSVLDKWVLKQRAHTIKTLKKLPPPKK